MTHNVMQYRRSRHFGVKNDEYENSFVEVNYTKAITIMSVETVVERVI